MNYLVIDTETGGLEAGQPIMQLAYNLYQNGVSLHSKSVYFAPQNDKITPKSVEVNGLIEDVLLELLAEQGAVTTIESEISSMLEVAKEYGAIIVGYNVGFDIKMLDFFANDEDKKALERSKKFDVKEQAENYFKRKGEVSLVNAYEGLFNENFNAHNALDDVKATWRVFREVKFRTGEMATQRVYKKIKEIRMACDNEIFSITIEPLHKDFFKGLMGYCEGDYSQACADFGIALTKEDCLDLSGEAIVSGYGTHSGKNLWQLPVKIKAEISKMLTGELMNVK